jgi:lysyl-tRNA synthetase class 2
MSIEEIRDDRIKKRNRLTESGINTYPALTRRTHTIDVVVSEFDNLSDTDELCVAGRITARREHGGSMFVDLYDGTEKLQGFLSADELPAEKFKLFQETVDIGDFVTLSGIKYLTKRGEKSVLVKDWQMLTKSLLPLPEKWAGLKDTEERFRKRYLDILFNKEVREVIELKAKFWMEIRSFLQGNGFLEVETPTLETTTGGAEATPFKTHHNDFDLDVYLRISVGELWQKRLMASGIPKTFEIGRVYRNEGSSPEHTQEFTNMEFYSAYTNFEDGKALVQEFYRTIGQKVFGKSKFTTRDHTFDLNDEWEELDYVLTVKKITGVDVLESSESELKDTLKDLGVTFEGTSRERMMDALWKYCRKGIAGPAFLLNHPKLVAPLSKVNPDNPKLTKTFQVILAGSEVGRAHAELNDPEDQRARFEEQALLIKKGDTEAMMPEWDFVEMLEYGMPPTFGFGVGDRLFSFFVDKPLRETQIFPLMKPKN